jgi:two-component system NtrC family response regulator
MADLPEEFHAEAPAGVRPDVFAASLANLSVLGEAERDAIAQVLEQTGGHQQRAAQTLGISRRTLQRRIKSYGLSMERGVSVKV